MVVVDPMLNDRSRLLTLARELVAADAASSRPAGASTVAPDASGPRDDAGSTAGTEPT